LNVCLCEKIPASKEDSYTVTLVSTQIGTRCNPTRHVAGAGLLGRVDLQLREAERGFPVVA
jgi:hypothetical protein